MNKGVGPSVAVYTCHDPREKAYMSQQWDVVGGQLRSRSPGAAGSCLSLNFTAASNGGALIVSLQ